MTTLTIRTDSALERALSYLQESTGLSKSQVTRDALLAAERAARREALHAEALALANDPVDRAAKAEVAEEMAQINAW
jgi:predicted transcriptional regulator